MTIAENLKKIIDEHCINKSYNEASSYIESFIAQLVSYIHDDYQKSAEIVQYAIGQLERVNDISKQVLLKMAYYGLKSLSNRFLSIPSSSFERVDIPWNEATVKSVMEKVMASIPQAAQIDVVMTKTVSSLTIEERTQLISYGLDSISRYGLQTSWDKNTIDFATNLMVMMYACCKEEKVLDLFFYSYYNIIDRLNTSGMMQLSRDFAESLIKIGYRENLRAEGYLGASRAYGGCRHAVAGLLNYNITLSYLNETTLSIPQRLMFEMVWQMVKLMRETRAISNKVLPELEDIVRRLHLRPYDELSFFHTVFSSRLMADDESVIQDATSFLDSRREDIFKNLEHSAVPWFSLINGMRKIYPKGDFTGLALYEQAFSQVMEKKGNQLIRAIYDETKDPTVFLKEYLVKMADTRNVEDYGKDSSILQILAQKVITKAANETNQSDFLLGMRVRSDFSFVMEDTKVETPYRPVIVEDVKGEEFHIPYLSETLLHNLMDAEKEDVVMWIGRDEARHYRRLTLLNNGFAFDIVSEIEEVDVMRLNNDIISKLNYCNSIKDKYGSIYYKSVLELEQEGESLHEAMNPCQLSIPSVAKRLLIVKDMELSGLPHQLLIDERGNQFIGELLPTVNIISTELFIKTNFYNNLQQGFSKTFWSPDESGEFTFQDIKGRLDELLEKYQFNINGQLVPDVPLCSDMNVVCAHGGRDISESEWFYANDKPIVETYKVVGDGKLLILFVCHSGSITYKGYDHSMHTIVKRYLRMGYSAVIAPMWSLPTIILPTWMKTFMEIMESGGYVIDAVYKANLAVKQEFVAPSAWACLHLFGNPYLKVADSPSLSLMKNDK